MVDPAAAELRPILCTARFKCFAEADPDIMFSELLVAWFLDDFTGDVREIVSRGVDGLDWAAHAKAVRYDDL